MRFQEFALDTFMPLSIEENSLVKKIEISENGLLLRNKLNIREIELARQMVSRGILNRTKIDENDYYTLNIF